MTDDRELAGLDPFALLDNEAGRLDAFLSGLGQSGWKRPSRCAGWTVRDVLGHLAPDAFRGLIDTISCLALPEEVLARPAVKTAVHREHRPPPAVPGPDRDQLLHLLTDTPAAAG